MSVFTTIGRSNHSTCSRMSFKNGKVLQASDLPISRSKRASNRSFGSIGFVVALLTICLGASQLWFTFTSNCLLLPTETDASFRPPHVIRIFSDQREDPVALKQQQDLKATTTTSGHLSIEHVRLDMEGQGQYLLSNKCEGGAAAKGKKPTRQTKGITL